ncbi:hypothetical protein DFH27DRAFT_598777 [Peziza echinospora]|nr:hypothetical protein DFH27DRAFT_598777 [Peziza echinospora]
MLTPTPCFRDSVRTPNSEAQYSDSTQHRRIMIMHQTPISRRGAWGYLLRKKEVDIGLGILGPGWGEEASGQHMHVPSMAACRGLCLDICLRQERWPRRPSEGISVKIPKVQLPFRPQATPSTSSTHRSPVIAVPQYAQVYSSKTLLCDGSGERSFAIASCLLPNQSVNSNIIFAFGWVGIKNSTFFFYLLYDHDMPCGVSGGYLPRFYSRVAENEGEAVYFGDAFFGG